MYVDKIYCVKLDHSLCCVIIHRLLIVVHFSFGDHWIADCLCKK